MKENKYKGTQTEKNLMAAFAGESEARSKYTYFASKAKKDGYEQIAALFLKPLTTKRSTQSCGSRNSTALAAPPKTFSLPQRVKTMNGPICMKASPKPPTKKAFLSWHSVFVW